MVPNCKTPVALNVVLFIVATVGGFTVLGVRSPLTKMKYPILAGEAGLDADKVVVIVLLIGTNA